MKCPYCRCDDSWKMMRQRWMRFTPGSMRNMRCSSCGAEFTKWLGFIPLRHAFARKLTHLWHAVLLLVLFTSLGFLIPALLTRILGP